MPTTGHAPPATNPPAASDAASAAPFDPHRGSHWLVHVGSPLGVSLALHGLMLLVLAGITWVVVHRSADESADVEFEAKIIAEGPADGATGGFRFPGSAFLDRPDSASSGEPQGSSLADLAKAEERLVIPHAAGLGTLTEGVGATALSRDDVIGTGGSGGALGPPGFGSGLGDRDAAGGGPIGSLWGVGEGQRAKTVMYVVDRSGSFVEWVEAIDLELKRSLGVLKADQTFNMIFLRENAPLLFKPRLVPGDEANKREAFAWINMHPPSGGSDMTPAVKAALKFSPEVLFIVTDQEFMRSAERSTNLAEMMSEIRHARKRQKTTINVILMGAFEQPRGNAGELRRRLAGEGRELAPEAAAKIREELELLETLAAVQKLPSESGGTLRYLNGDALMEQWRRAHGGM